MNSKKILVIVAIFCAVIMSTSAIDSCSGGHQHNAVFAHVSDCTKYHKCVFGKIYDFECPKVTHTHFDSCTKACGASTANCLTCNSAVTTTVAGITTTLAVDFTTTLAGDTTITGDTTVTFDTTTIAGDTTITGETTVAGSTTTPADGSTTTASVPTAPIIPPTPTELP